MYPSEIKKKVESIAADQDSVLIEGKIFSITRLERAERLQPLETAKSKGKRGKKKEG